MEEDRRAAWRSEREWLNAAVIPPCLQEARQCGHQSAGQHRAAIRSLDLCSCCVSGDCCDYELDDDTLSVAVDTASPQPVR